MLRYMFEATPTGIVCGATLRTLSRVFSRLVRCTRRTTRGSDLPRHRRHQRIIDAKDYSKALLIAVSTIQMAQLDRHTTRESSRPLGIFRVRYNQLNCRNTEYRELLVSVQRARSSASLHPTFPATSLHFPRELKLIFSANRKAAEMAWID